MPKNFCLSLFAAGAVLTVLPHAALADPPGRVGRLSYIEGTMSSRDGQDDSWDFAVINAPVTNGNSFWAQPGARGEIQVGSAVIRIGGSTELDIVRLDDSATELSIPQGELNIALDAVPEGGFIVDTPAGQVDIAAPGRYHVEYGVNGDGMARVGVFDGQARVGSPAGDAVLADGHEADWSPVQPFTIVESEAGPLDQWALSRGGNAGAAVRYVSPDVTGYQDLDAYGQWAGTAGYGAVWYPAGVPAGWEPYRYGHWNYVRPWGWTWIDDQPWGFAPFHYGRWVRTGNRWGWWPGQRVAHPVYAPALVQFIGGTDGTLVVAGTTRAVGWVPLAPYEVYRPWYTTNEKYWRSVNRAATRPGEINTISITVVSPDRAILINQGRATIMPVEAFRRGDRVFSRTVNVAPSDLARMPRAASIGTLKPAPGAHDVRRPADMAPAAAPPQPQSQSQSQARVHGRDDTQTFWAGWHRTRDEAVPAAAQAQTQVLTPAVAPAPSTSIDDDKGSWAHPHAGWQTGERRPVVPQPRREQPVNLPQAVTGTAAIPPVMPPLVSPAVPGPSFRAAAPVREAPSGDNVKPQTEAPARVESAPVAPAQAASPAPAAEAPRPQPVVVEQHRDPRVVNEVPQAASRQEGDRHWHGREKDDEEEIKRSTGRPGFHQARPAEVRPEDARREEPRQAPEKPVDDKQPDGR